MKKILLTLSTLLFSSFNVFAQNTFYVPDDFSSIQSGIDGIQNGDTLIVRNGTYIENINFNGKAITLKSEYGSSVTRIDGSGAIGSVVKFISGEGADSILEGFSIINGFIDYRLNNSYAGGIDCIGSSPTINDCVIRDNTSWAPINAARSSGGMYVGYGSAPAINDCTFTNNYSAWRGGAIFIDISKALIRNCIFDDNTAGTSGGAIYIRYGLQGNNISRIYNCTFIGNSSVGARSITGDYADIRNCIFRNRSATPGGSHITYLTGGLQITYSNVEYAGSGTGNIDLDPLFSDPIRGDYSLQSGSPCIDAGDPNGAPDSDGTVADMGAIPFIQAGNTPSYSITNLIANQYANFSISQAGANVPVIIGYSLTGAGPTNTAYGSVNMSLPIRVLVNLQSNASGDVSFSPLVPSVASGMTFYTQALCGGILSNPLAIVIQ